MFKGCHFPSEVILETIRYYLAYKLCYREIEEIQLERGVIVDHTLKSKVNGSTIIEQSINLGM
ncbi:hypothetical protein THF1D04_220056 [Vibrio owensii]|uniref:IS6 family transposase n=1 Tax=Vibrio owensii TaxID=696485 RepID=A0AAU9Q4T0_9VIBR|nr:hypothetical protein THF1D04_220056 [Vibrio owensii]